MLFLVGTLSIWGGDHCETTLNLYGTPTTIRVEGGGQEGTLIATSSHGKFTIDRHVVTKECHALTLFGKRGVAIIAYGMAVRFYEPGPRPSDPWTYFDIYTFYTASWQGGLLQVDVDRDGHPDLFCGNYWIRNPGARELPWRLYAINAFHEHPDSATAQLHWDARRGRLLWVESHRPAGRVVWFQPPADVHQLWIEEHHPAHQKLDCPQLTIQNGKPVISASTHRCP